MTRDSEPRSSRLSGFYQKSVEERIALLARWADLSPDEVATLRVGLALAQADKMIENVVGRFALPLGIGANFTINGADYLVPMAVEEPSVVAGVSYAARLARAGGGFRAGSTEPVMIGQVQLLDVANAAKATRAIAAARDELLSLADTSPTIARLGGGPRDVEIHAFPDTGSGAMLVVHLLFDCRDAMGANAVNTAVETIAPMLEQLSGGRALLRILSNYSDRRRAWAETVISAREFSTIDYGGEEVIRGIVAANDLALVDPYRAATHNKGIFNGIDGVLMATGNDWRAVEAGGHAYAARSGRYRALTDWRLVEEPGALPTPQGGGGWSLSVDDLPALFGRLEMPLAVGIVGGATRAHPTAAVALKILGVESARRLSEVVVSVGLAQNLAALRALVTDGIQRGHMRLHARQIAIAAGASGAQVDLLATRLVGSGEIRLERARELLNRLAE